MIEIYHNPRCRKSRAALQYLRDNYSQFKIIEYLKEPLDSISFGKLLKKLGKRPSEMMRTNESIYKSEYKGKEFSDAQWIKIMVGNPTLIKRPIVVKDDEAIWADPSDLLISFLD